MRCPVLLCSLALFCGSLQEAIAQELIGEFATIHVSAKVADAPCWLKLSSRDQTVELPPVATSWLRKPGMKSAKTYFRIEIRGCIVEQGVQMSSRAGLRTWSPDSPVMSVAFTGVQDNQNPALFAVVGVTGVGLEISDEQGNALLPGIASAPQIHPTVNPGLSLYAALVRTPEAITTGPLRAVLQFVVTYD